VGPEQCGGEECSPQIKHITLPGLPPGDGSGTPEKVPALKNAAGRFLHVAGGRSTGPGTWYRQSALTDAEVAGVLNWI
jgi:hypothetical protein